MTTIKASCPSCGDVELTPAQVQLVVCTVKCTVDCSGFASAYSMAPSKSVNRPRTLVTRWRTWKIASEWDLSILYVLVAVVVVTGLSPFIASRRDPRVLLYARRSRRDVRPVQSAVRQRADVLFAAAASRRVAPVVRESAGVCRSG